MTDLFYNSHLNAMKNPIKIEWQQLPGYKLKATWTPGPTSRPYGLNESDMEPIHEWCADVGLPAVRISFDTWRFRSAEEMTAFLLRWS